MKISQRIVQYTAAFALLSLSTYGQLPGSLEHEAMQEAVEPEALANGENKVLHPEYLSGFFQKLEALEAKKQKKINIVHIGDSHIQADLLTGRVRDLLQDRFGNGGLGFSFPYKLAKTNGTHFIAYQSNVDWSAYRNIFPVNGALIGLSGIALSTTSKDFAIELNVKNNAYKFSRIKVFTPNNLPIFDVAVTEKKVITERSQPKKIVHKIQKGESLSTVARKYKVGVNQIKQANNLKTNLIRVGKTLTIPTKEVTSVPVQRSEFTPLNLTDKGVYREYVSKTALDRIFIIPHKSENIYSLNGFSLENADPGIVYHSIGVNGARFSDYNKYNLFFEQVQGLEPDVIVLSMGTNEAFDRMETANFQAEVDAFVANIKRYMPHVEFIITTPSPSFLPKQQPNVYAEGFADSMVEKAESAKYAVWDTFHILGGNEKVSTNFEQGLLSRDYVHYSKSGYEYTGALFYEALMQAYASYKSKHTK